MRRIRYASDSGTDSPRHEAVRVQASSATSEPRLIKLLEGHRCVVLDASRDTHSSASRSFPRALVHETDRTGGTRRTSASPGFVSFFGVCDIPAERDDDDLRSRTEGFEHAAPDAKINVISRSAVSGEVNACQAASEH